MPRSGTKSVIANTTYALSARGNPALHPSPYRRFRQRQVQSYRLIRFDLKR